MLGENKYSLELFHGSVSSGRVVELVKKVFQSLSRHGREGDLGHVVVVVGQVQGHDGRLHRGFPQY